MFRKTFTTLSLIGLLLSTGLWGVTAHKLVRLTHGSSENGWGIEAGNGKLQILRFERICLGIAREDRSQIPLNWRNVVFVELSVRFVTLALASAGVLICCVAPFRRRRKRTKLGLCVKCGYDLRGSENRCPECGEVFAVEGGTSVK